MAEPQDPPIVVTGGSITIKFDPDTFTESGEGEYSNPEKIIKRVEISGADIPKYDEAATGKEVTIKITYDNP